jgi:hypothetical protein
MFTWHHGPRIDGSPSVVINSASLYRYDVDLATDGNGTRTTWTRVSGPEVDEDALSDLEHDLWLYEHGAARMYRRAA